MQRTRGRTTQSRLRAIKGTRRLWRSKCHEHLAGTCGLVSFNHNVFTPQHTFWKTPFPFCDGRKRWVCTPQHDTAADDGAHSGSSFVGAILFRCMEVRSGTFGDRLIAVPWFAFVIPRVDGLVAETAQDLYGSKAARLWWTLGRVTEHCSCHHASLHGPENVAGTEGCRRPREDRMPRSRADGTFFPRRMRAVQLDMHTL